MIRRRKPRMIVEIGKRGGKIIRKPKHIGGKAQYLSQRAYLELLTSQRETGAETSHKRKRGQLPSWAAGATMPAEMGLALERARKSARVEVPATVKAPPTWPLGNDEYNELIADFGRLAAVEDREYCYMVTDKGRKGLVGRRDSVRVEEDKAKYMCHVHPTRETISFVLSPPDLLSASELKAVTECVCDICGTGKIAGMRYDPSKDPEGKDRRHFVQEMDLVRVGSVWTFIAAALRLALQLPSFAIIGGDNIVKGLIEYLMTKKGKTLTEAQNRVWMILQPIGFLRFKPDGGHYIVPVRKQDAQRLRDFGFTVGP